MARLKRYFIRSTADWFYLNPEPASLGFSAFCSLHLLLVVFNPLILLGLS